MKMFKSYAIAAIASLGMASAASAQTFSPDGARTITGSVEVSKGLTLNCSASGTASVTGGAARVDSLALSTGFLCSGVTFSGFPYAISASGPSSVTINNVVVTAITGSCAGSISGSYDQSTGEVTFDNAQLPTTTGGSNCAISGSLVIDPAATITF